MEIRRIGGGLLAGAGICAPWVADMMGLTIDPIVGYWLLAGCALIALAGLLMAFWPAKKSLIANRHPSIRIREGEDMTFEDIKSNTKGPMFEFGRVKNLKVRRIAHKRDDH